MTDIEQEFFKVFEIEPKVESIEMQIEFDGERGRVTEQRPNFIYPKITDRMLLELICMLNTVTSPDLGEINYGRLKLCILEECINALNKVDWQNRIPCKSEYIEEIQSLFREEV